MPRHTSRSSSGSKVLRRLAPYNKSPNVSSRSQEPESRHDEHHSSGRKKSKSNSRSRSKSPAESPEWAKALLRQQGENAEELRRLKTEIEHGRTSQGEGKEQRRQDPVFRYVANKKQYDLNKSVAAKIDEALESRDDEHRRRALNEGKKTLTDRNKHILLAEKFGWDTVECYTAEPLASDSDDERKIKKAVKESQRARDEKKKRFSAQGRPKKPNSWGNRPQSEPKVVFDKTSLVSSRGHLAGKSNSSREKESVCFRCFRPGHFARDCRAANAGSKAVTFNSGPPNGGAQQLSQ